MLRSEGVARRLGRGSRELARRALLQRFDEGAARRPAQGARVRHADEGALRSDRGRLGRLPRRPRSGLPRLSLVACRDLPLGWRRKSFVVRRGLGRRAPAHERGDVPRLFPVVVGHAVQIVSWERPVRITPLRGGLETRQARAAAGPGEGSRWLIARPLWLCRPELVAELVDAAREDRVGAAPGDLS